MFFCTHAREGGGGGNPCNEDKGNVLLVVLSWKLTQYARIIFADANCELTPESQFDPSQLAFTQANSQLIAFGLSLKSQQDSWLRPIFAWPESKANI